MNKYFYESVGECVSQVYEIVASDWEEAKRKAFVNMETGDILAEGPASAVKEDSAYHDYSYIECEECEQYITLKQGMWENDDFDETAYYWSDDDETAIDY